MFNVVPFICLLLVFWDILRPGHGTSDYPCPLTSVFGVYMAPEFLEEMSEHGPFLGIWGNCDLPVARSLLCL
jgi:hypothetical protein